MIEAQRAREMRNEAIYLPSWYLTQRQVCDSELLLNGAFWPLAGFMGKEDYGSVCHRMRLKDDTLWPIPITLDVTEEFAGSLSEGDRIALRHPEGQVLAVMTVSDIWEPDLGAEAESVYGTTDETHPGVFYLFHQSNRIYVGGEVEGLDLPPHHTYKHLRQTPAEMRAMFKSMGWRRVVAFQTRNPMHRSHVELTRRAMAEANAALLIHPVVGSTRPGDIDYFVRVRCCEAVLKHYPGEAATLSLLPLAMRMAGPREALWHALIRKNYGCTHFIIGRDHAGPGNDRGGQPFYEPYAACEMAKRYERELGIEIMTFEEMVYAEGPDRYVLRSELPQGEKALSLSGTELRRRLWEGLEIPAWFSYPEVLEELRRIYPPPCRQGFTVFCTGLPSSGKSTVAGTLMTRFLEIGTRPVTLLDGDVVRTHLSSELGFSKHHRDLNIARIGFVASEITKNRGIAICAPIAPYRATRRRVREMVSQYGGFIEVYVATPLEVCETRDLKGLYAKARAGLVKNFTGIDDPYEAPEDAEVIVDTSKVSVEEAVQQILLCLQSRGYIGG